jgi:hypothetical protein
MQKFSFYIHFGACLLQKNGDGYCSGPLSKGGRLYRIIWDENGKEQCVHSATIVSIEKGQSMCLPYITVYGNQAAFIPIGATPTNTEKKVLMTKSKEETVKVTIELVDPSEPYVCAFGQNLKLSAC